VPKPFDATVKDLAAQAPQDFITVFDQPPVQPVRVLNVDLSTVTAEAARAGTAQRLRRRLLACPRPWFGARPWYLNSLWFL